MTGGEEHQEPAVGVDQLIAERERLDQMLNERFTRVITVMFTDLKGSTAMTESHGDLVGRTLIKHHNDLVFPIISEHNGTLVKTMGDGTLSYFENAQDALRAAAKIQAALDEFNLQRLLPMPILMRIGIHTGKGIVEKTDIFGDVVNVASRFESAASPGEIFLSEETYSALTDKGEIYCRFIKSEPVKGKKEPVSIYKAFWNPTEAENDMAGKKQAQQAAARGFSPLVRLLLIAIPIAIVIFAVIKGFGLLAPRSSGETRSKQHSITLPAPLGK
jgi:class 3 adenylate cyclase